MMRQWASIKGAHPDCIVLFRLGDFYEAFNEDAGVVAEVCGLTLTGRPVRKGVRAPMAGVPYHAADGHIARLVKSGLRVAIVEQVGSGTGSTKRSSMSPPSAGAADSAEPGLVEREVVRIVSAGTLLEPAALELRSDNNLAALVECDGRWGLAHADQTTGVFKTTDLSAGDARTADELARIGPVEIVAVDGLTGPAAALLEGMASSDRPPTITRVPGWRASPETAERDLKEAFGVLSLDAFGCADRPAALTAAGLLTSYLRQNNRGRLPDLRGLATYDLDSFLYMDADTRRNLELVETLRGERGPATLAHVLDQTRTPMGARLLRRRLAAPLVDLDSIQARLDEVEALLDDEARRAALREVLSDVGDIERLTNRVTSGYANPRELLRLRDGLAVLPAVSSSLSGSPETAERVLRPLEAALLEGLADVTELISAAVSPDAPAAHGAMGAIRPGYSPQLDAIHASVAEARAWIAGLEATERARTGLKSLKVGYNRVFGYYLEVPKSASDDVPDDYMRRQTLVGAERYVTTELKERESEVLSAEERIQALERTLFQELTQKVAGAAPRVLAAADEIARIDVAAGLAELARRRRYSRPELDHSRGLVVEAGRHPVIEALGGASPFVPTDIRLAPGQTLLLTGPNMAGKSTVLRQTALMVVMAQMGSFVPAGRVRLGIVDRVFTRIGARDDLALGQSTFMVEMVETARVLHHATERSLVILDELGRGTSTYDGMAIAWAVLEALQAPDGPGCRTLFATHFHELTALEERLPDLANAHMAVADTPGGIAFLHRVDPGPADRSYGIHVAELAGVPPRVTARAWELLARLEQSGAPPFQAAGGRPAVDATGQLALFEPAARLPAWASEVAAIDVEQLTPLQAMNALAALVARARMDRE